MCAPTFRSHDSSDLVACQGLLYFIIGGALGFLYLGLKHNSDDLSTALPHAVLHRSLNPGEVLVVPPVQKAPPYGIDPSVALFYVDSLLCVSAACFLMSVKWALPVYSLCEGRPMIKGCADAQNEPYRFEKWPFDFLLENYMAILLAGFATLVYGVYQRI